MIISAMKNNTNLKWFLHHKLTLLRYWLGNWPDWAFEQYCSNMDIAPHTWHSKRQFTHQLIAMEHKQWEAFQIKANLARFILS